MATAQQDNTTGNGADQGWHARLAAIGDRIYRTKISELVEDPGPLLERLAEIERELQGCAPRAARSLRRQEFRLHAQVIAFDMRADALIPEPQGGTREQLLELPGLLLDKLQQIRPMGLSDEDFVSVFDEAAGTLASGKAFHRVTVSMLFN